MSKKKAEETPKTEAAQPQQTTPLFYTIAINPVTGEGGTRTNAATIGQLQIIANALLQEYTRLNQQVINAVSQSESDKKE